MYYPAEFEFSHNMRRQIINRFLLVVGIAIVSFLIGVPSSYLGDNALSKKLSNFKITLGLDLAGGTELDYKIDLTDAIAQNEDDDASNNVNLDSIAESVRDALEKRVNPAGVGEIVVKRALEEDGHHIIIQMPPSSNVAKAKQDAEQDNRLDFFEESPEKEVAARAEINDILNKITPWNWAQKGEELGKKPHIAFLKTDGRYRDQIQDTQFADKLFAAAPGSFLSEVIETQTEAEYTVDDKGALEIKAFPSNVLGLVRVTAKAKKDREKTNPPSAEARHILFAYPEARRADEEVKYKTKEEAKSEAEKMLEKLKKEGTANFAELAKEFSTESAAKESGGELGEFTADRMVKEFSDAVFAQKEPGLLPSVVESPFGFHVIEVEKLTPESKQTVAEDQVSYEMIAWDRDELRWEPTELGGAQLENSAVGYNEVGQPVVNLLFDQEGGDLFAALTEKIAAKQCDGGPCRLGIKVGGKWITQPTVKEKIVGRSSQITGSFTFDSAKALSDGLNLGAIDAPVILSGQTTITPQLGADQLAKSLHAGLVGFLVIMVFMLVVYRFAGLVASFVLAMYAGIFVTILKVWPESFGGPIVLSLAGIAGVILSIGLAVDGNILIFERLKDELRRGRNLTQALDLGFERAWAAIRDSHCTTLISCLVLFSFGSAIIKGFAVVLIVGTVLSLFTAITISRNLLRFSLLFEKLNNPWLFGFHKSSLETDKNPNAQIRKR